MRVDNGPDGQEFSDVYKLRIAAVRTHLAVAADTRQVFSERLMRLRGAYQILAARRGETESPELAGFVVDYNKVRSAFATSLYPGRERVPPSIRA